MISIRLYIYTLLAGILLGGFISALIIAGYANRKEKAIVKEVSVLEKTLAHITSSAADLKLIDSLTQVNSQLKQDLITAHETATLHSYHNLNTDQSMWAILFYLSNSRFPTTAEIPSDYRQRP